MRLFALLVLAAGARGACSGMCSSVVPHSGWTCDEFVQYFGPTTQSSQGVTPDCTQMQSMMSCDCTGYEGSAVEADSVPTQATYGNRASFDSRATNADCTMRSRGIIASKNTGAPVRVVNAGAISPLVMLLGTGSIEAKEEAAEALRSLAHNNPSNQLAIATGLVALLGTGTAEGQEQVSVAPLKHLKFACRRSAAAPCNSCWRMPCVVAGDQDADQVCRASRQSHGHLGGRGSPATHWAAVRAARTPFGLMPNTLMSISSLPFLLARWQHTHQLHTR